MHFDRYKPIALGIAKLKCSTILVQLDSMLLPAYKQTPGVKVYYVPLEYHQLLFIIDRRPILFQS
jgi:hypothetical protein